MTKKIELILAAIIMAVLFTVFLKLRGLGSEAEVIFRDGNMSFLCDETEKFSANLGTGSVGSKNMYSQPSIFEIMVSTTFRPKTMEEYRMLLTKDGLKNVYFEEYRKYKNLLEIKEIGLVDVDDDIELSKNRLNEIKSCLENYPI